LYNLLVVNELVGCYLCWITYQYHN
jgi:hypothetical protein